MHGVGIGLSFFGKVRKGNAQVKREMLVEWKLQPTYGL